MRYGKITDGVFRLSPPKIILNGKQIWNPTEEQLIQAGYKEIHDTDMPEEPAPEGQHYEAKYEDTGDNITQVWELVDDEETPLHPPTLEERVTSLEENIGAMIDGITSL